jgi:uncharacterized membrane protein YhaH (DUF805 family)
MENYPSSFNPISATVYAFKHYADFKGRARRSEFWLFYLTTEIISSVLNMAWVICLSALFVGTSELFWFLVIFGAGAALLTVVIGFAMLVPYFACWCRRLHDVGMSGLWLLALLIPGVGIIAIMVISCFDSKPGPNKYGPNPKEVNVNYYAAYTHEQTDNVTYDNRNE